MSLSTRLNLRSLVASASIIGVLLASLMLGGCSAVRLGYNNGPSLMYWWLDSYFDFDDGQTRRMRRDLQAAHDWHRKTELPLLANTLKELMEPLKQCYAVAITRAGRSSLPELEMTLQTGDMLNFSSTYDGIGAISARLAGKAEA